MKKFILFCILALIVLPVPIRAASSTSSATSTPSAAPINPTAQELLDRVATQVAQLANQLQKVYVGTITSVGTSSYIITTPDGDKTVGTNDVTTFYRIRSGNTTSVTFDSLKSGDDISAMGNIDPQTNAMTAREIIAKIKRFNIVGKIATVSGTILTVQPSDGLQTSLDISTATSLKKLDPSSGKTTIAKPGDFKAGNIILAIAYYSTASDTPPLAILRAVLLLPANL